VYIKPLAEFESQITATIEFSLYLDAMHLPRTQSYRTRNFDSMQNLLSWSADSKMT